MSSSRLRSAAAAAMVASLGLGLGLGACGKSGGAAAYAAESTAKSAQAAANWLKKNAQDPGVKVLPDGLQYKIVRTGAGEGASPRLGDDVRVMYEGALPDGTVFDSSYARGQPDVFTVGEVVPAWNEALQLMKPGDVWYIYVPPALGYGPTQHGPIPGNSVMVFKLELISVLPKSTSAAGGANA